MLWNSTLPCVNFTFLSDILIILLSLLHPKLEETKAHIWHEENLTPPNKHVVRNVYWNQSIHSQMYLVWNAGLFSWPQSWYSRRKPWPISWTVRKAKCNGYMGYCADCRQAEGRWIFLSLAIHHWHRLEGSSLLAAFICIIIRSKGNINIFRLIWFCRLRVRNPDRATRWWTRWSPEPWRGHFLRRWEMVAMGNKKFKKWALRVKNEGQKSLPCITLRRLQ